MSRPSLPSKQKYVTRACDACKKRKSKCDGLEPCARCLNSEIECTYNSSYNRVQKHNALRQRQRMRLESQHQDVSVEAEAVTTSAAKPSDSREVSSNGKDDDDTGDASVHAFLRRVSGHLAQIGQGLPRNLFKQEKDTPRNGDNARSFLLLDKHVAQSYVDCYYEHANVTYRYVPRGYVSELLNSAYTEDELVLKDDTRMALLLTVMGMGCRWTASWKNQPLPPWRAKAQKFLLAADQRLERAQGLFPPTLNLLQALVLKSQLELASSRYNSAWVTLGLAVRLGQMIDIQREPASGSSIEAHYRRCTFWAMFMIDRYLAVSLGRSMAIHESDITVSYPTELHPRVATKLGAYEKKLLVGVVAHVKLTQIIGHVITRIYRGTKYPSISEEQIIIELETELRQWLHDTPEFFHPKSPHAPLPAEESFYDVPWIFRRQQKTIQASYYFANMLIYRDALLQEFLHQAPSTSRVGPSSEHVKACVDNALAMAVLAADFGAEECKYNATFWTTSHFIFCAISILLVYLTLYRETVDHAVIESAVEEAMKVHRKLDYSDNIRTQKLLEESRSRTENVRNMTSPASSGAVNRTQTHNLSRPDQLMELNDNRDPTSHQPRVEVMPISAVWQLQQQPQEQNQDDAGPEMFGNMMRNGVWRPLEPSTTLA